MCICVPVQMLMVKAIGTIHKVCVFVLGWLIIGATFQSHFKKKKKNLHYVALLP